MNMWFWMNKAVRIRIDQGTLLIWILNSCCFDHDDVIWNSSKGESSRKQGEKMRHEVERKVGGTIGTYNRKQWILFWCNTDFKCCFRFFSIKHGTML